MAASKKAVGWGSEQAGSERWAGWPEEARGTAETSLAQWAVATAAVAKAVDLLGGSKEVLASGALSEDAATMDALAEFGRDLSSMDDQSVELAAGMLRGFVVGIRGELGQERWREIHSAVAAQVLGPARARLHEGMLGTRRPSGGAKI